MWLTVGVQGARREGPPIRGNRPGAPPSSFSLAPLAKCPRYCFRSPADVGAQNRPLVVLPLITQCAYTYLILTYRSLTPQPPSHAGTYRCIIFI